jgi:putative ABC transport system permease protein
LVIAQFAVSIGLTVCTTIVYGQTVYARSVDPGYNRNGVLQVQNVDQLQQLGETFAREVGRVNGVVSVGRTGIGVSTGMVVKTGLTLPGLPEPVEVDYYSAEPAFFRTMGIKFLAGRNFDERRPMDEAMGSAPSAGPPQEGSAMSQRGLNIVVNERAAKRLGYRNPAAAVGKTFKASFPSIGSTTATIIGVVQDSRFRSVRDPVDPIIFRFDRSNLPYLVARYERANAVQVRKGIEAVWKRLAPEIPFEAKFSEEVVQKLYEKEETRGQIFAAFALVAILISSLGLYGLAAFTAERRTKEIGIRKVLGAKVRDIVRLLAWQFSKPVILANLIAWPVAWWVMRDWLNSFDARIELGLGPFLLAGLLALLIAVGTIAGHAIKVSRANPIHALRYE